MAAALESIHTNIGIWTADFSEIFADKAPEIDTVWKHAEDLVASTRQRVQESLGIAHAPLDGLYLNQSSTP